MSAQDAAVKENKSANASEGIVCSQLLQCFSHGRAVPMNRVDVCHREPDILPSASDLARAAAPGL